MYIKVQYVDNKYIKGYLYFVEEINGTHKDFRLYSTYHNCLREYLRLGGTMPPKVEQGVTR